MKVYFFSNFFNHHQKYLCDALYRETCGDFKFVESIPMPQERLEMGYNVPKPDYVVQWQSFRDSVEAGSADAVIMGSAPEECLEPYIKNNKPVFRYAERPLRKGIEPLKYPFRFVSYRKKNPSSKRIYLLCASAFTALDYTRFGMFKNRMYKWGYFPDTVKYDSVEELIKKKNKKRIIWVGRLLELKHPDDMLAVAKRLKDEGYDFVLDYIGSGVMLDTMVALTKNWGLEDCVNYLGAVDQSKVRAHMENAGIFVFNSDRREGWGAVINEAMNSCCAVVTSNAPGAVPYLIKNNVNGLVYPSCDTELLYKKVKSLLDDSELIEKYGSCAYRTIANVWNAESATKRFLTLAEKIINKSESTEDFADGPCSRAQVIGEDEIL